MQHVIKCRADGARIALFDPDSRAIWMRDSKPQRDRRGGGALREFTEVTVVLPMSAGGGYRASYDRRTWSAEYTLEQINKVVFACCPTCREAYRLVDVIATAQHARRQGVRTSQLQRRSATL